MGLPRIVVTGASGFLGRYLLDALKQDFDIVGIARRSQARSGAPVHPNIRWIQVDIGELEPLEAAFKSIRDDGGAQVLLHLAAHYDFTGETHPEYFRTNIDGLRFVLENARTLGLKRFIFSSSVAASAFPPPGGALSEVSEPDGDHVYAQTKRVGEEMVTEYREYFPSTTVRFAALFSNWCEYPPLFMFLSTWLSTAWNRRVLGGRGRSAIPYLHVRDAVFFLRTLIDHLDDRGPAETLIASPDGAVSHEQLFEAATLAYFRRPVRPVHMPRVLCGPGIWMRYKLGQRIGNVPFERPWMARYIDQAMTIDASRTRAQLGWSPRPRLAIRNRIPFMIENLRSDPVEWNRRNRAAMKQVQLRDNLKIHWLLQRHEDRISEAVTARLVGGDGPRRFPSYQEFSRDDLMWNHKLILRQLMNTVRTGEKSILMSYCVDLAERRFQHGFSADEICAVLDLLNEACVKALVADPDAIGMGSQIHDYITTALRFGTDQVLETFDHLAAVSARRRDAPSPEERRQGPSNLPRPRADGR